MTDSTHAFSVDERTYQRRWWILGLLCLSLLIVVIGNTTLNVVLPTLSKDLGATESQLQWVVAIYSLVFAGLLFTTGALGDRFGRKGALQVGLLIFLAGSTLASVSSDMTQLILCRGLMGIGASLIMPSTLSILINVFPPHERPKAIAIWASIAGGGGSFGPILGGALLTRFWWGSVFLVNVPIIIDRNRGRRLILDAEVAGSGGGGARSGRRGALDRSGSSRMVYGAHPGAQRRVGSSASTVMAAFAIASRGARRVCRCGSATRRRAHARHRTTSSNPRLQHRYRAA